MYRALNPCLLFNIRTLIILIQGHNDANVSIHGGNDSGSSDRQCLLKDFRNFYQQAIYFSKKLI